MSKRNAVLLVWRYKILLVVLLVGVVHILSLTTQIGGHDQSQYVMLAQSIAGGQGFRQLNLPGNPPEKLRVPGFPLLLAPIAYLWPGFPENLLGFRLVSILFSLLSLVAAYYYFVKRKGIQPHIASLMVLLLGLNPLMVVFSSQATFSEIPYLFFSVLALSLLEGIGAKKGARYLVIAAFAILASYFIRVVGIALLAAGVSNFLLRKRWKEAAIIFLVLVLFVLPWAYRNSSAGTSALTTEHVWYILQKDYQRPHLGTIGLQDMAHRLLNNIWGHTTETISWLFIPWAVNGWWPAFLARLHLQQLAWTSAALGLAVSGPCILGYILTLKEKLTVTHLYVFFLIGIILLAPWYVERNLWPLLPFLLYYFAVGLRWFVERASLLRRKSLSLAAAATVVALCIILFGFAASDRHLLAAGAAYRAGEIDESERVFGEMCEWIRNNTSPDDLLLYRFPVKTYLYTRRKVMGIPMIIDHDAFLSELNHAGVDYVVLEPDRQQGYEYGWFDQVYLQPAVTAYPQSFVPVHQIGTDPDHPALVIYRFESLPALGEEQ